MNNSVSLYAASKKSNELMAHSYADMYAKGVGETRTCLEFPSQHWRNIRKNNILGFSSA